MKISHTRLRKINSQTQTIRPINAAWARNSKAVEAFQSQEIQFYSPRPPIIPTQGFLLMLEQRNCTRNTAICECRSDPSHKQNPHTMSQSVQQNWFCKLLGSYAQSVKDFTMKICVWYLVKHHTTVRYGNGDMATRIHSSSYRAA